MSTETYRRLVIDEDWEGDVLPGRPEELLRQVIVRPRNGSLRVRGGVLGHSVAIYGPAEVVGHVYGTREVLVDASAGAVSVHGGLGATESLEVRGDPYWVTVLGNVAAGSILLRHCACTGCVSGDDVRTIDTVTLGLARSTGLLRLERTVVLMAAADHIVFENGCGLILPFAKAARKIELVAPVGCTALDDPDACLGTEDLGIAANGAQILGAGRRATEMARLKPSFENVLRFAMARGIGERLRDEAGMLRYDPSLLPSALQPLLPANSTTNERSFSGSATNGG